MEVKQYDKILLKDKRTGFIVEVLEKHKAYIADLDISKDEWETVYISHDDIENIIN